MNFTGFCTLGVTPPPHHTDQFIHLHGSAKELRRACPVPRQKQPGLGSRQTPSQAREDPYLPPDSRTRRQGWVDGPRLVARERQRPQQKSRGICSVVLGIGKPLSDPKERTSNLSSCLRPEWDRCRPWKERQSGEQVCCSTWRSHAQLLTTGTPPSVAAEPWDAGQPHLRGSAVFSGGWSVGNWYPPPSPRSGEGKVCLSLLHPWLFLLRTSDFVPLFSPALSSSLASLVAQW